MISSKNYNHVNCPECGGFVISIAEKGEMVCGDCGLVVKEKMDTNWFLAGVIIVVLLVIIFISNRLDKK